MRSVFFVYKEKNSETMRRGIDELKLRVRCSLVLGAGPVERAGRKGKLFSSNFVSQSDLLQYYHQISGIGSEQEKSLYSSCFFTDEKRQYTDEGDEQAVGKVKGDGGRCHREGFSGGQRAKRENQGQVQNVGADDITC